jgi:hypothetical protein
MALRTKFITLTDLALYAACPFKYYLNRMRKVPMPLSPLALDSLIARSFCVLQECAQAYAEQAKTQGIDAAANELLDVAIAKSISHHAQEIMDIDFADITSGIFDILKEEAKRRIHNAMGAVEGDIAPMGKGGYICDFAHRLKGTIPAIVRESGTVSPVVVAYGKTSGPITQGEHWVAMGMGLLCRYACKEPVTRAIRYDPRDGSAQSIHLGEENKERTKALLDVIRSTTVFLPRTESCSTCEYGEGCEHYAHRD